MVRKAAHQAHIKKAKHHMDKAAHHLAKAGAAPEKVESKAAMKMPKLPKTMKAKKGVKC